MKHKRENTLADTISILLLVFAVFGAGGYILYDNSLTWEENRKQEYKRTRDLEDTRIKELALEIIKEQEQLKPPGVQPISEDRVKEIVKENTNDRRRVFFITRTYYVAAPVVERKSPVSHPKRRHIRQGRLCDCGKGLVQSPL